jgi:hypothetical protein
LEKKVTLLNARLEIACGINFMRHQRKKKNQIVAPKNEWVSSWVNQKQESRKKIGTKILPSIEPSHKHTKTGFYLDFSLGLESCVAWQARYNCIHFWVWRGKRNAKNLLANLRRAACGKTAINAVTNRRLTDLR